MKKVSGSTRRIMSIFLIAAFLFTDFAGVGADYASKATAKRERLEASEAALRRKLAKTTERYPNGAFDLLETQLQVNESIEKKGTIAIVREGGLDSEATVTVKAVDVTAAYDEDYRLYVDGEALKKPENAVSMLELFGDSITADYADGPAKKRSKDGAVSGGSAAVAASASKAKEKVPEIKKVKEDSLSPLQRGVRAQTGKAETQKDWREITETDPDYSEAGQAMEQGASNIQKIAEAIEGTSVTLTFEKGEYKKEIEVEVLDDDISEGEEQIALILSNPVGSELGAKYHGYLNIEDDEEEAPVSYEIRKRVYTVGAGEDEAHVTIVKKGAADRMTVTDVACADGTAKAGENYAWETQPVVFVPGETEKEIIIPVRNLSTKKDIDFTVGVNSGAGKAEGDSSFAVVKLKKREKPKKVEKADASNGDMTRKKSDSRRKSGYRSNFTGGAKFSIDEKSDTNYRIKKYEGYRVPDSVVCKDNVIEYLNSDEHKNVDDRFDRWIDIPLSDSENHEGLDIDFTNVSHIEIEFSSKWNEGKHYTKRTWIFKKKSYYIQDREIDFCINGDGKKNFIVKKESTGKIKKTTCTLKPNGKFKGYGRLQYLVKGTGGNKKDGASIEIYKVRIYYKKLNVVVYNKDYDNSNFYMEKIYRGDKKKEDGVAFNPIGQVTVDDKEVEENNISGPVQVVEKDDSFRLTPSYNTQKQTNAGLSPNENNTDFLGYMVLDKKNHPLADSTLPLKDRVDICAKDDGNYSLSDIVDYYDYAHDFNGKKNCIVLVPVFVPKRVKYIFQSIDGSIYNGYKMNRSEDKALEISMLDTVKVHAAPKNKGTSVSNYSAVDDEGVALDVKMDPVSQEGTIDITPALDSWNRIVTWTEERAIKNPLKGIWNIITKGKWGTTKVDVTGKRRGTPVVTVNTVLDKLMLTVMPRPVSSKEADTRNLDKMAVAYIDPNGKEAYITDKDSEYQFTISDSLANGSECTLVGVGSSDTGTKDSSDHYTIVWQDATCDTDNDGKISAEEMKKMYGTTDQSKISDIQIHSGDAWKYTVNKNYTKLYYQVRKVNPDPGMKIAGAVCVKDSEIYTGKEIKEYVNGATVVMGGDSATTKRTEPTDYYKQGGNGYYAMDGGGFLEWQGRYNVSVNYSPGDGSTMHGHVYTSPNTFTEVSLLTDSVMKISGGSLQVEKEKEYVNQTDTKWDTLLDYNQIDNSNHNFKLNFTVASSDPNRIPKKAYLRFYSKEGNPITLGEKDSIPADIDADGKVSFIFNPQELGLAPGTTIRIQVEDQMKESPDSEGGTLYPERRTGICLKKALDQFMLMSSFVFGADTLVVDILGAISGAFDLGSAVDLNFKTESGVFSSVDSGERNMSADEIEYFKRTANKEGIGEELDFDNNPQLSYVTVSMGWDKPKAISKDFFKKKDAAKKKAEADEEYATARMKNEIIADCKNNHKPIPTDKEGNKYEETSPEDLAELEEKVKSAQSDFDTQIKNDLEGKKEKKSISANLKINLKFYFVLNFYRDPLRTNNPLYFDSFMLCVEGDGNYSINSSFMLPIGITINIGFSVGGNTGAAFIVESPLDDSHTRYYMEKLEDSGSAASGSAATVEPSATPTPTPTPTAPVATATATPTETESPESTQIPAASASPEVVETSGKKSHSQRKMASAGNVIQMETIDDVEYLNIFRMIKNHDDFEASGVFEVNPDVTLTAGAGYGSGVLSIGAEVGGKAHFKMNFFTGHRSKLNDNYGTVTLEAHVTANVSVFSKTWRWKTDPVPLFGTAPLSKKGFDNRKYIAEDASVMKPVDFDYMDQRSGWQGDDGMAVNENNRVFRAAKKTTPGVLMKTLQQQVYAGTRVDIKSIGGGDYMAVFLDADPGIKLDINRVTAYYSIYKGSTGKWSRPIRLDNDKTGDEDVKIVDLGERGMIVLWVDSSEVFSNKTPKTTVMAKKNLSGRFFDKSSKTFGQVMAITRETKEDPTATNYGYDLSADLKPNIVYSDSKKSMICYYTKCEYDYNKSAGEKIGDITYPTYAKMAYREYRFSGDTGTDGEWIEDYTKLTDQSIQKDITNDGKDLTRYQKIWYGQVTFETMPDVYIEESLDEEGYWTADMLDKNGKLSESRIFKGHKVNGGSQKLAGSRSNAGVITENTKVSGSQVAVESAPRIVDTDAISYRNSAGDDYGLFAYTVDYDQDLGTVKDRDIYLQYFDFKNGYLIHPIVLTSDDLCDCNVRFVKNDSGTYLAWIHDGDLVMFSLHNLEDHLIKRTKGKNTYYILDKTAPQVTKAMTEEERTAAYEKAYIPTQMIVDGHRHIKETVLYPGDEGYPENKTDGAPYYPDGRDESEGVITDFDVSATGDTTFFTWTETVTKLKKGISKNSIKATLPKNQLIESQIWMTRIKSGNDSTDGEITEPVKVTNYAGANFGRVTTEVTKAGGVKLIAIKAGTKVVKNKKKAAYASVSDKKDLVAMDVVPDSKPEVVAGKDILKNVKAGETGGFSLGVHNNGLARSGKVHVTAVDKEGVSVLTEMADAGGTVAAQRVGEIVLDNLLGGTTQEIACEITPKKSAKSVSVTVTLNDDSGHVLDKRVIKQELRESTEVSDLSMTETNKRDRFVAGFTVSNVGARRSKARKATIGIIRNKKKIKLKTVSVKAMEVGQSYYYECPVKVKSSKQFVSKREKNGDIRETGVFYVEFAGDSVKTMVTREATALQVKQITQLADKPAGGNKANIAIGQQYYGLGLRSKRKSREKNIEIPGVKVIYVSEDPTIAGVSSTGVITGWKKGTTKVKVIAMPEDDVSVVPSSYNGNGRGAGYFANQVDGYVSWPTKALKIYSVTVNVAGGSKSSAKKKKGVLRYE